MICALDVEEFVPYGRQHNAYHPGNVPQQSGIGGLDVVSSEHGMPLHKAIQELRINEMGKKDFWRLRAANCIGSDQCEEELYIHDQLVVWSRGTSNNGRKIIKSFTVDSPVHEALWCSFVLPLDHATNTHSQRQEDVKTIPAKCQQGVCIVQSNTISVYTTDGHDYGTTLPFQVANVWCINNGLLVERLTTSQPQDVVKTPKKDNKNLPVLFSVMHPLDEATPVICKTGGSSGKVSFVTDTSQQIVFSCDKPSLLVTYDNMLKAHSVWTVRAAKPEDANTVLGTAVIDYGMGSIFQDGAGVTPGLTQSASGFSCLTISNNSPSYSSPLLHMNSKSRLASPSDPQSKTSSSPSLSRLTHSHSPSPGLLANASFYRLQTPSPQYHKSSPSGSLGRTPASMSTSYPDYSLTEVREPLVPEICLDHVWTEGTSSRDASGNGKASKVFLIKDLCGQQYLCYLITFLYQLRCVKFNESNDRTQLIFGSVSVIQARDAVALKNLDMTLILDMKFHLVLYSGVTKVNQVHVSGLPDPHSISLGLASGQAAVPPTITGTGSSPVRLSLGPVTSSRPPSAVDARFFSDERQRLSPVPTEPSDTSQVLENSLSDDLSFHMSHLGHVTAIRDAINNKFTLELSDNQLFRAALPPLTKSHTVQMCLDAIKQILPKDLAMFVLTRWYSSHNAPGSYTGQSEWQTFVKCLLAMVGYDVEKLALTRNGEESESSMSPVTAAKKLKPSDQGADEDWSYLMASDLHQAVTNSESHLFGFPALSAQQHRVSECAAVDSTAPLFAHLPALLFALHLVYEEMKLDSLCGQEVEELAALLSQMARDLQCELYTDYYSRDFPNLFAHIGEESLIMEENFQRLNKPSFFTQTPPCIFKWLCEYLEDKTQEPFPYLYGVSVRTVHVIALYVTLFTTEDFKEITWSSYLRKVATAGIHTPDIEETIAKCCFDGKVPDDPCQRVVLYMSELDTTIRDSLQHGVALPLKEAIFSCRNQPPGNWPAEAYTLIGREDLAKQKSIIRDASRLVLPVKESAPQVRGIKEEEDGMENLDNELLKLQFSKDLRVQEVRRLLQSSQPVRIAIQQRPEVSDPEYIEEQERHLYCTCIRTMALPLGRGMFTLSTYHPVPTETVPIPKLCLTGRAPPRNTTVDLNHIETPPNMTHWPQFHNGVAAGLRIANTTQLDSAWIIYNRPQSSELTNEHAGFLMGLGLNGHLNKLATINIHDYLVRNHDMTSIGLLLGLAAGKRGSMDVATVRMLSIHISALLPPTSTELDVPHNIQVTAIMGVGLVYQGTANRHIAEILLQEIGRPPGPEMANCTDRESYSLASGLALGLVMLGRGSEEIVLSELNMADELYHYMVGGQKRPLSGAYRERYRSPSYQIKEGDAVNVDVTSPGATLALGLMFFNTKNSAVAEWLTAPDTQFLLDFVRPDFLMLRIISRGLVMWDKIYPTTEWVNSNLPEIVAKYAFDKLKYADDPDCDIDFETMSQAYCNIVAGACMALGLKFAGTSSEAAFNTLFEIAQKIVKLLNKPLLVEQAGKSTVENCFIVIVLSLAMVTAGTGDLQVLRLCRYLRARVGQTHSHVLYGSHMAVSMAIGLLFLGGGRYSLNTSPESVAAMLCAFFPKFPIHSNDNRYHLQAFRHLYVLAAEPRVLIPRDVSSGDMCYVPLEITFKKMAQYPEEYTCEIMAPWILPELDSLKEVKIIGKRYWNISFHKDKNWDGLMNILKSGGCLYVKQRAGHLSYAADPKGYHSVLSTCLTGEQPIGRSVKKKDIKSFSSDPRILAFAEYFCSGNNNKDSAMIQFLSRVLYECVSQEKLDVLPVYITLQKMVDTLDIKVTSVDLWQLKLMLLFYKRQQKLGRCPKTQLISSEFLVSLTNSIQHNLHVWIQEHSDVLLSYYSGQTLASTNTQKLSAFLTWYNVPHPALLGQIGIESGSSFPDLYKKLQPLGLSLSAVMAISLSLQHL